MSTTDAGQVVFLSTLLKHPVRDHTGRELGRLSDILVTLPGGEHPPVTGLLLSPGDRDVFISADQISAITPEHIELATTKVDLRPFTRRDGEVKLRGDVLDHRLLDIDKARLVRAYDIELMHTATGWVVKGVDVHRAGLWQRLTDHTAHTTRAWAAFEALIGHQASATHRGMLGRIRRLKPAQIADLLEAANRAEQDEILAHVHSDPELEADVFEELDHDRQTRLLAARTDTEISDLLSRMNADDAADALMELPQERRRPVLDGLPARERQQVTTLLSHGQHTAGGLMSVDFLTLAPTATAAEAIDAVRGAHDHQPQAVTSVFLVDPTRRLLGAVTLVAAVQAEPDRMLEELSDRDPTRVLPDTDPLEVTRLMADYNLLLLPVVDTDNRIIGVVTVDDALEAAIPDNWRQREQDNPLSGDPR